MIGGRSQNAYIDQHDSYDGWSVKVCGENRRGSKTDLLQGRDARSLRSTILMRYMSWHHPRGPLLSATGNHSANGVISSFSNWTCEIPTCSIFYTLPDLTIHPASRTRCMYFGRFGPMFHRGAFKYLLYHCTFVRRNGMELHLSIACWNYICQSHVLRWTLSITPPPHPPTPPHPTHTHT